MAASLVLGIFVAHLLRFEDVGWMWVVGCGMFVVASLLVKDLILRGVMLMGGFFCLGGELMSVKLPFLYRDFPRHDVVCRAVVASEPVVRGKIVRCQLVVVDDEQPFKIQASFLRDTLTGFYRHLSVGDGVEFRARIDALPDSSGSSRRFNFFRSLRVQGVVGQTFIPYWAWTSRAFDISSLPLLQRVRLTMLRFRRQLIGHLADSGLEGQQRAIVSAMALGDKSALDRATREAFSISGASHVLALSGLHLGIIYFLGTFLIRRRRWNIPFQVVSLVAVWAYATLVGLAASVVRAATMLTTYGLIDIIRHAHLPLNALALAALGMLVCNPMTLFDVGFQMSFMAVLGIFAFYQPLFRLFGELQNPLVRIVWSMVSVSVAAQLTVCPLILLYFGRFSCYFFLSNFVAIPAVWMVLVGVLAFFILSFAPVLQSVVAQGLQWGVGRLQGALEWIAALPGSSISDVSVTPLQVLLYYVLLGGLWAMLRRIA